jgi:GDP-mannose transporter
MVRAWARSPPAAPAGARRGSSSADDVFDAAGEVLEAAGEGAHLLQVPGTAGGGAAWLNGSGERTAGVGLLAAAPGAAARSSASAAVLACVLYSLASIAMVLFNKLILSSFEFRFDMVLLCAQNLSSLVLLLLARWLGLLSFEAFEARKAMDWLPLNVLFVGMLYSGYRSLGLLSVPLVTVFKNSSNLLVTFGDWVVYGQRVSAGIVLCLALMVGASALAAANDTTLSRDGVYWALVNGVVSAAYVLYMPRAMRATQLSSYGKVFYNSALAMPTVFLLDGLHFGDFARLARSPDREAFTRPAFLLVLLMSGVVGFSISFASFRCVGATSPTTYSLVGSINKIPLSVIGVLLFKTELTLLSAGFIFLSLLAGILYAYVKSREEEAQVWKEAKNKAPQLRV